MCTICTNYFLQIFILYTATNSERREKSESEKSLVQLLNCEREQHHVNLFDMFRQSLIVVTFN